MSKIVYNTCFGGFSLSQQAIKRYAELSGITLLADTINEGFNIVIFWFEDGRTFESRDLERHDPVLVQVVEELGDAANGSFASLKTAELPSGSRYRIDEYEGMEKVMTPDDYEWRVAP